MKYFFLLTVVLVSLQSYAQKNYTINNETLLLYQEAEGAVTLLWNIVKDEYRYFIKKDTEIIELKNTRAEKGFMEEYKTTLKNVTGTDASKVKLTTPDLIKFIDTYNTNNDPSYVSQQTNPRLETRLGGFAGVSNYIYFVNPDNTLLPQLGVEFEVFDALKLKRHSIVFQLRQLFAKSDYDFSSTQLNINYRFKFIHKEKFAVFTNAKIGNCNYISQDIDVIENNGEITNISASGGDFEAPFGIGIGAEFALGKGFITFLYQDIFALNLNESDEFPVDFALGYKFRL